MGQDDAYEELQDYVLQGGAATASLDDTRWMAEQLSSGEQEMVSVDPDWVYACAALGYSVERTADVLGTTVETVHELAADAHPMHE